MKDNFSHNPGAYAAFRPQYPPDLFDWIAGLVPSHAQALDVATGNGQAASQLARHFEHVFATDISPQQLAQAVLPEQIHYSCQPAEQTNFSDAQFDLVCVAQAVHWFDFEPFFHEVHRILKPGGIFAAVGYGLFTSNPEADAIIRPFYNQVVGPYWDPERKYIDAAYQTIPFPFEEIPTPNFKNTYHWDFDRLIGYIQTWSAVRHYEQKNGENPVDQIRETLRAVWEKGSQQITLPWLLRVGRK